MTSQDSWCNNCNFASDPYGFYSNQAEYTPGKLYSSRFKIPLSTLQAARPTTVVYQQQPYETTRDAVLMHLSQCCPVDNFDMQFRRDNIEGMQYISEVRGVPLPPIRSNTQLVPLPRQVYESKLIPPLVNTYNIEHWINGSKYYNERLPGDPPSSIPSGNARQLMR